jgi:hypothetical protein
MDEHDFETAAAMFASDDLDAEDSTWDESLDDDDDDTDWDDDDSSDGGGWDSDDFEALGRTETSEGY